MDLTKEQEAIKDRAIVFAKRNKKAIAKEHTDPEVYPREEKPVSVFMAGSPGAGKTEASIELLSQFTDGDNSILRIDPDDLRAKFEDYTGDNSFLFQGAVSILVERIHDLALKQGQSFVLDGTLSNFDKAYENVGRSLQKGRMVQILYVYQRPELAWEFVRAREDQEGRRINKNDFIQQYFAARDVVNRLKDEFGKEIKVDLLLKNNDNSHRSYKAGIDKIDHHVPERYTRESIEELLGIT